MMGWIVCGVGPPCPKCGTRMEGRLDLSSTETVLCKWCPKCDECYMPGYGGTDEKIDIGGVDGFVRVITMGHEIMLEVDGRRVMLPPEQARQFCEAVRGFGADINRRVRAEKVQREQLERWLLHQDGATYRTEWQGVFHVKLRETTPRRDWNCSTCKRELPAGKTHWLGEFPQKHWGRPEKPRFCSACVHESRSVAVTEPKVPMGLRLVGKAEEA